MAFDLVPDRPRHATDGAVCRVSRTIGHEIERHDKISGFLSLLLLLIVTLSVDVTRSQRRYNLWAHRSR